jgi:altronate dehydratase large subunit
MNTPRRCFPTGCDQVADEIVELIKTTATGTKTKSEELGHREFILTYTTFEPSGPNCFPAPPSRVELVS